MYIIWIDHGAEGWKRIDADTTEDAVRIRDQQISLGDGEIIVTELVTDLGAGPADPELRAIAKMREVLTPLNKQAAQRALSWASQYVRDRADA